MATAVYILSALTCLICAVLLLRGFARTRVRLLLWSGLCFAGFAINNALLFVDNILLPHIDLFVLRNIPTMLGLCLLLYGLIWEER